MPDGIVLTLLTNYLSGGYDLSRLFKCHSP
jgi:hypothetical protein